MTLTIKITQPTPGHYVVALDGRLDALAYAAFEKQVSPLLEPGIRAVTLDLSRLAYISSMGLRTVFKIRRVLEGLQGVFMMTGLQPQIAKVFEIAQALPKQVVFTSVAEADRYLSTMQARELEKQRAAKPPSSRP